MSNYPVLLTDQEFADMLRLSKVHGWRTIQKWCRAGKLRSVAVRVGDQWRFPMERVQEWIARGGMRS